jgi:hypothetical protein
MPPVFTDGQCTAEFDEASALISRNRAVMRRPESAQDFFKAANVPATLLTVEQCRVTKPRFLDRCGPGPIVYANVPVKNKICSVYRDEETKLLLRYDEKGNLVRFTADMAPYKSLPIPFTSTQIHWAR